MVLDLRGEDEKSGGIDVVEGKFGAMIQEGLLTPRHDKRLSSQHASNCAVRRSSSILVVCGVLHRLTRLAAWFY